jgi:hypothetical protein
LEAEREHEKGGPIMAMFSTLSPHWTLAAGTSGSATRWTTIIVFAILVVAGLAAAWTLKKD